METLSKICCRCKVEKPLDEFYKRKNSTAPVSECKNCMKERNRGISNANRNYLVPRAATETLAINYLHSKGIPALPGKALRHSHVDVIAFGCIDIEVKYARYEFRRGVRQFVFNATPAQKVGGFRAQIVMLVCDYETHKTFHFFNADDEVFYMKGRLKYGFTFTPGNYEALKHGNNRIVMVQGMMDEAEGNVSLIYAQLKAYCAEIKKTA